MTENEAIKAIENDLEWHSKELQPKYKAVLKYAIQALEEIQEYRAIGTIEEFKAIKQWKSDIIEAFCKYDASSFEELIANARNKAITDFAEKLKEKSTSLKSLENDYYGYVSEDEIDEVAELMKKEV